MTMQKFGVAPAMKYVKSAPNQFLPGRGQGVKGQGPVSSRVGGIEQI